MNATEAIARRRSIRTYDERMVSKQQIESLLKTAFMAPSAGDVHPYEVVVVLDEAKRSQLAKASLNQNFISEAPVNLVFLVDKNAASESYGTRGLEVYSLLDVGAAVENLMLAAVERGLETCWIGAFNEQQVSKVVGAPRHCRPVTIVTLGYSRTSGRFRAPPRLHDKVYLNSHGLEW